MLKMQRVGIDEKVYLGVAEYNPRQEIPINPDVKTYLVVTNPEDTYVLYVVQVAGNVDGFKSLGEFFLDMYGWEQVRARIFTVNPNNQKQVFITPMGKV